MLHARHITAGYGDVTVLRDVSISVPAGTVVALLGANGAGKTTLVRTVSGLLRPSEGTISVDEVDLTTESPHARARRGVCHVPEGRGIFGGLSVRENLVLQGNGIAPDQAIEQALTAFPALGTRLDQIASTLSGGEQQMVSVARAYISNPQYVLLDEVSLGLAPKVVDVIFEFLASLVERGTALLLVEQYVVRALHLADFVYVLDRGRVAFAGESDELDEAGVFRTYSGIDAHDQPHHPSPS